MTDHVKPFSAPEPRGQNDRQVILLTGSSGLIRDGPLTCSSSATPTAAPAVDPPSYVLRSPPFRVIPPPPLEE
jgi:hypothetical protein